MNKNTVHDAVPRM